MDSKEKDTRMYDLPYGFVLFVKDDTWVVAEKSVNSKGKTVLKKHMYYLKLESAIAMGFDCIMRKRTEAGEFKKLSDYIQAGYALKRGMLALAGNIDDAERQVNKDNEEVIQE